jgi:hypothetical protein
MPGIQIRGGGEPDGLLPNVKPLTIHRSFRVFNEFFLLLYCLIPLLLKNFQKTAIERRRSIFGSRGLTNYQQTYDDCLLLLMKLLNQFTYLIGTEIYFFIGTEIGTIKRSEIGHRNFRKNQKNNM